MYIATQFTTTYFGVCDPVEKCCLPVSNVDLLVCRCSAGDGALPDERGPHPGVLCQTLCHQQGFHGQRALPAAAEQHAGQQPAAGPSRQEASGMEALGEKLMFSVC